MQFETWILFFLTTSQSASLAARGRIKRGSHFMEPKAPQTGGGEAPTARSGFFTSIGMSLAHAATRIRPWLSRIGKRFNQVCGGLFIAIGAALALRA